MMNHSVGSGNKRVPLTCDRIYAVIHIGNHNPLNVGLSFQVDNALLAI